MVRIGRTYSTCGREIKCTQHNSAGCGWVEFGGAAQEVHAIHTLPLQDGACEDGASDSAVAAVSHVTEGQRPGSVFGKSRRLGVRSNEIIGERDYDINAVFLV